MIRPVTFVSFALALSSGAWMFVVKHRAEQLDRQIGGVTAQIRASEQRIRVLRAEWALETDPNRLARLAAMFLPALKPMAPDQLVTWSQLADRLPPPGTAVPSLPLPPPLPDQVPNVAVPAGPVASAQPPASAPRSAAPAQLAAASPAAVHRAAAPSIRHVALRTVRPVVHSTTAHPPVHPNPMHRVAVDRPMPIGQSVLAPPRRAVRPMGARVMTITAHPAPVQPAVPRSEPVSAPSAPQSVFGGYAANLPPPRPAGGTVP
ncbi:hypothetical protein AiwAL_05975 [Acidiphilium sp. AL]|uniref:Secreted (Periplasmic) protein-like protein n=1 Tax=Acidiphilium iwatense TaxID=768198 RepID=A0ABS9DTP9_9PROT|nr:MULTISPECIES: hypothetical protein [Acidiphilium]MCF3945545.1 hypothetical protein [Acidiphilium iwatense]MCU4159650.1 hypothetical protein [Acidiphilium sp. AL]